MYWNYIRRGKKYGESGERDIDRVGEIYRYIDKGREREKET